MEASTLSDVCGKVCACVCPYLQTSGSGPVRSGEMVGISRLKLDLRWGKGRVEGEKETGGSWKEGQVVRTEDRKGRFGKRRNGREREQGSGDVRG